MSCWGALGAVWRREPAAREGAARYRVPKELRPVHRLLPGRVRHCRGPAAPHLLGAQPAVPEPRCDDRDTAHRLPSVRVTETGVNEPRAPDPTTLIAGVSAAAGGPDRSRTAQGCPGPEVKLLPRAPQTVALEDF